MPQKDAVTKQSVAGFQITGEFTTQHARNLWAEGSFRKCFDFLECLDGITIDQIRGIIDGKLKLTGVNNLDLVDDNWIPDDICDGGGTFLGHFQILKAMGYEKIGLYTTHGLYTKGIHVLSCFDAIYSTNSYEFGLPIDEYGQPTNNTIALRKVWDINNLAIAIKETS